MRKKMIKYYLNMTRVEKCITKLVFFGILLGIGTTLLYLPNDALYAQFDPPPPQIETERLQVDVSPVHPRPGQSVSVSVKSFSSNISQANISWYSNGTLAKSAIGDTRFVLVASDVGSVDTVRVTVALPGRSLSEETVSIVPTDVTLIWQAHSYTPPFYRGKALHATEGSVTVFAIPNIVSGGSTVATAALRFTWEQNGSVLGRLSGIGRDTLVVDGSILSRPVDITVAIETLDGRLGVRRTIRIPIIRPEVHLYENHPVLGILFNKALIEKLNLQKEETTLEAFPYFFSSRSRTSSSYSWRIGGTVERVGGPSMVLRRGSESGVARISVEAKNSFGILESTDASVSVEFN